MRKFLSPCSTTSCTSIIVTNKHSVITKLCFILGAMILASTSALAQVRTDFNHQNKSGRVAQPEVSFALPQQDLQSLISNEPDAGPGPFMIAEPQRVNLDIAQSAKWTEQNGIAKAEYTIQATGAKSISVNFDRFHLPQGTEMFLYSADREMMTGPITEAENNDKNKWGSWVYKGELLTIEIKLPAASKHQLKLHISNVAYGYKEIYKTFDTAPGYGNADACMINVLCPEGSGWENERNAVGVILNSTGTGLCSGALINNACSMNIPYFLTADHCFNNDDVSAWRITFQAWSPDCSPTENREGITFIGSTLRANYQPTDMCLLELNQVPDPAFGLTYSGWNRGAEPAQNAVGLHHPKGDVMKISIDHDPATFAGAIDWTDGKTTPLNTHWRVTFDKGGVQPGSSGSPLFDQNHRIVGQLHGGVGSCAGDADFYSAYGRIDASWTGGGTKTTSLRSWLDPFNSGTLTTNTISVASAAPDKRAEFNEPVIVSGANPISSTSQFTLSPAPPSWLTPLWTSTNPTGFSIDPVTGLGTRHNNYDGQITIAATLTGSCANLTVTEPFFIGSSKPKGVSGNVSPVIDTKTIESLENVNIKTVSNKKAYLLWSASTNNFPSTDGSSYHGAGDMVLAIIDSTSTIVYATYIGGSGTDTPIDIKVEDGMVYILGTSYGDGFPVTDGSVNKGMEDITLVKLNPGVGIVYSKYFGGSKSDEAQSLAVEKSKVYILSKTESIDIPVTDGSTCHKDAYGTPVDIVIFKLDAGGSVVYSGYKAPVIADTEYYYNTVLKVENEEAYFSTNTMSWQSGWGAGWRYDYFLTKLNADGTNNYRFMLDYFGGGNSAHEFVVENGEAYINYGVSNSGGQQRVLKVSASGQSVYNKSFPQRPYNFPYKSGRIDVKNGEVYYGGMVQRQNDNGTGSYTYAYDLAAGKLDVNGEVSFYTELGELTGNGGSTGFLDFRLNNNKIYILGSTTSTKYPVTNNSTFASAGSSNPKNDVITILNPDGSIGFSSYIGEDEWTSNGRMEVDKKDGTAYIFVTNGMEYSSTWNLKFTKVDPCPIFPTNNNTVTPAEQIICKNGIVQQLTGSKIESPAMVRNGSAYQPQNVIEAKYQWQVSKTPTGPWENIIGAALRNYKPKADTVDRYFRRIAHKGLTCNNETISISPVVSVLSSEDYSPEAYAGGIFYTCPGATLQIGGHTGVGGFPPYSYSWDNGANPEAFPHITASEGTKVYTLTVTDSHGCTGKSKAYVIAVKADAGPKEASACGDEPVTIGTPPVTPMVAGASIYYKWTPEEGLYNTDIAQPDALPDTKTKYVVELQVSQLGQFTCSTKDTITVNRVYRPKGDFAGRDTVLCFGTEVQLGTKKHHDDTIKFKYFWSPGGYLKADTGRITQFIPGDIAFPKPNPILYYLSAITPDSTCFFRDSVEVAVIQAKAGPPGDNFCPPLGQTVLYLGYDDPTPHIEETYLWTKESGEGRLLSPSNKPKLLVSVPENDVSHYKLTATYNKKTCTDEKTVGDFKECHCTLDITGINKCPRKDPDDPNWDRPGLTAYATQSLGPHIFTWEAVDSVTFQPLPNPGIGLSDVKGQTVYLTDTINRTYRITARNPVNKDHCSIIYKVRHAEWSKPRFKADKFRVNRDSVIHLLGKNKIIPGYRYEWEGAGLSCNDCPDPKLTVTKMEDYPVLITDDTGCQKKDTVHVAIKLANAGPDKIVCNVNDVVEIGTPDLSNGEYMYSWAPTDADWRNGTDDESPMPQVAVTDTLMVFLLTVTDPATGDTDSDDVNVKIHSPSSPVDYHDSQQSVCKGSGVIIGRYPQTDVTYSWEPTEGLADSKASSTLANPTKTTDYILTATYPGGCVNKTKATVFVIDPSFTLKDTTYCPAIGAITLGTKAPLDMYAYQWFPEDSVNDATIRNPFIVTPPPPGIATYKLRVTDNAGCQAVAPILVTTLATTPYAGAYTKICKGSTHILGNASNASDVTWTITSGPDLSGSQLSCTPCAQPSFTPTKPGTYNITASQTASGCATSSAVTIVVEFSAVYHWTVVSGPDTSLAQFNCTTCANPVFTPSAPGTYVLSPNTTNGCTLTPINTLVAASSQPQPMGTAGSVAACTGKSITLTNPAPTGDGSTITVVANSLPSFSLTDKTFCPSGGAVTLGESAPAGMTTYSWSPSYLVSNSTIQNPSTLTPPPTTARDYTLTVTDNNGCKASDIITITPSILPPDAGAIRTICAESSTTLGNPSLTGTLAWIITSGPNTSSAQLSCTNCAEPVFTPTLPGNYYFKLTSTIDGCSNSGTVNVYVNAFTLGTFNPVQVCKGNAVFIGPYQNSDVSYSWSPITGLSDPNDSRPEASPSETTIYTLTATAISGMCAGSSATASVTVTVNDPPAFTLTDKTYCPSDGAVTLGDSAPSGMSTYRWSPTSMVTNATIKNPSTLTPPPGVPTTYSLMVTDSRGCNATSVMTISPTIAAPLAGTDRYVCLNVDEYLGDAGNLDSDTWSMVSGPDMDITQLSCTTCAEPLFTPKQTGTYSIMVSRTVGSCTSTSKVIVIVRTFTLPNLATHQACLGSSLQIGTNPEPSAAYYWEPTTGLSDPTIANPIATATENIEYTLTAIGSNGCPATTTETILVLQQQAPDVHIPNLTVVQGTTGVTFTPVITPSGAYQYTWAPNDGSLSDIHEPQPFVLTTSSSLETKLYSLTVTNATSGCSVTKNTTLTVLPGAPTITAKGSTQLCDWDWVQLTSDAGNATVWNTGETGESIWVSSAGIYTATVSRVSPVSNSIEIIKDSTPEAPFIEAINSTVLCDGSTVTLTSDAGELTNWSNGSTGESITVDAVGEYYAGATNACGSSYSSNIIDVTQGFPEAPMITALGETVLCPGASVILTSNSGEFTLWSNGSIGGNIVVENAGTFTATLSNACGSSPVSNSITVTDGSPTPPVIAADGPVTFCLGLSVTLTSDGGSSTTWSNGSTGSTLQVNTDGTYTATRSNECGVSVASNSIVITTQTAPGAPVITANGPTEISNGQSVTLTSDAGAATTWSTGSTGESITVNTAGTYTATANNDCGTSAVSNGITITIIVGVEETEKRDVIVVPNPTKDQIKITVTGGHVETFRVQLVDMTGKIVFARGEVKNGEPLVLEGVASGLYYLKVVEDDGKTQTTRLIVL